MPALIRIDFGMHVADADGAGRADFHAFVVDAAAAGGGDEIPVDGALVARDRQRLYDVGIVFVAAHRELDALFQDGALLINAAPHVRLRPGDDDARNLVNRRRKIPFVGAADHFF